MNFLYFLYTLVFFFSSSAKVSTFPSRLDLLDITSLDKGLHFFSTFMNELPINQPISSTTLSISSAVLNLSRNTTKSRIDLLSIISSYSYLGYSIDSIILTKNEKAIPTSSLFSLTNPNESEGQGMPEGLDLVFKRNPSSLSSSSPRIPFIVHQTWKNSRIKEHSNTAVQCYNLLQKYASNFIHVLWTDADIKEAIHLLYPKWEVFYNGLNINIKRADVARYLLLHYFGGVYMDLDIELKRSLKELVDGGKLESNYNSLEPLQFFTYKSKEYESQRNMWKNKVYSTNSRIGMKNYRNLPNKSPSHFPEIGKIVSKNNQTLEAFAGNSFFGCVRNFTVMTDVVKYASRFNFPLVKDVNGVLKHTGPVALGINLERYMGWSSNSRENLKKYEVIWYFNSSYSNSSSYMKSIKGRCITQVKDGMRDKYNIRIYSGEVVGNIEDKPSHAVHERRHSWTR